jgi:predicted nucleic acid-binding protein
LAASTYDRIFLDTNILVYAVDYRDPAKLARAQTILRQTPQSSFVISAQVLGEFYWTVTRKLKLPVEEARAQAERLSRLIVVALDTQLVHAAMQLVESASIEYWDALIVKAASSAGCARLLTEDLNYGQLIDGVRVENPFIQV